MPSQDLYRQLDTEARRRGRARYIFDMYISTSAPSQVNLDSTEFKKIEARMAEGRFDVDLFDDAQAAIFALMQTDPFPRFVKSIFYICSNCANFHLPASVFQEMDAIVNAEPGEKGADGEWKDFRTKNGCRLYRKKFSESSSQCVAAQTVVHAPPKTVIEAVCTLDVKERQQWDKMVSELRVLEEISPTQLVYYMAFRTIVPGVTNRDFCGLRIVHEAKDGTFYLLFRSVEHPDCPPRDDYIRGEAFASGFVIKPHKEPGTSITYAHVTVINQADMMGKVPKGVRSKLGRKRQGVLKHLRSYCEARFAEAVKANEHE